jgi:CxxC motif-containing protein (DUF1111 family)
MRSSGRPAFALTVSLTALAAIVLSQGKAAELAGRSEIKDPRNPPPWIDVHPAARRDYELGLAVFRSQWQPAGHPDATANKGLGPLFVESSCDACHADGGRGRPAAAPAGLSNSFVMQLGGPATALGHVVNTRAIDGHAAEGRVEVTIGERAGRYPDGLRWTLRQPRYSVQDVGPALLPATTVLKPRIGPALFGTGLLDAVPQTAVESIRRGQPRRHRGEVGGRFGWQGIAISLVDQTAIAFSREMGLTSELEPQDDCTPVQATCRQALQAGAPEVAERIFHAVNTFQFLLAAPTRATISTAADTHGAALFDQVGCAVCHVPQLPVPREGAEAILIDPYTDLLLHDLGGGLADRNVAGRPVTSQWRTAPLWGLAHALRTGPVALLHDGRAGSIEEAILWHEGQAADARRRFMSLDATSRRQLLDWVATL